MLLLLPAHTLKHTHAHTHRHTLWCNGFKTNINIFPLYHTCIHTFNTTLTLTEIKKRHNLHCHRVLIQVMNQRTLNSARIVYVFRNVCVFACGHVCVCMCVLIRMCVSLCLCLVVFDAITLHYYTFSVRTLSKDHNYRREVLTFPLNGTRCFG